MTSNQERVDEPDVFDAPGADFDDDVTFAASSDVVGQIREQAAQLRRSAAEDTDADAPADADESGAAAERDIGNDEVTVALDAKAGSAHSRPAPRATPAASRPPVTSTESLIADKAPPASSASYWNPNDVAPTRAVEALPQVKRRVPMWAIIAALVVLIVIISVVIAVLVGSGQAT